MLEVAEEPVKNVCNCGTKATTVVVGTVVVSFGATVVNIISLATGAFAKGLASDGADVSHLTT